MKLGNKESYCENEKAKPSKPSPCDSIHLVVNVRSETMRRVWQPGSRTGARVAAREAHLLLGWQAGLSEAPKGSQGGTDNRLGKPLWSYAKYCIWARNLTSRKRFEGSRACGNLSGAVGVAEAGRRWVRGAGRDRGADSSAAPALTGTNWKCLGHIRWLL